jgi:hypothetical protein
VSKLGGAPEVFGGYANPAIITYLSKLDKAAADTGVDLSDLEENVDNLSILLSIARQDINSAEIDIVDLQQRMLDEENISVDLQQRMAVEEGISTDLLGRMVIEEGISTDLLGRMVIEEGISDDLQDRMNAEEAITAVHEAEITSLQDAMTGQQSAMDLAYKRIRLIEYPIVNNITGTVPLLVGQLALPAGDYSGSKVNIGCSLPGDSATLSIMSGSSELVSITRTGPPLWVIADDFTLAEDAEVKLWLSADTTTATAIVYCIKFEVS